MHNHRALHSPNHFLHFAIISKISGLYVVILLFVVVTLLVAVHVVSVVFLIGDVIAVIPLFQSRLWLNG